MDGAALTANGLTGEARQSRFLDHSTRGNGWQQIGVGVLAIVLALVLVAGQIALATTRQIQHNLHATIGQLSDGNATMQSIIHKSASSATLGKAVAKQAQILEHTERAMGMHDAQLAKIQQVTNELQKTVKTMASSSDKLSTNVGSMRTSSDMIGDKLGALGPSTQHVSKNMSAISLNSTAINSELQAIGNKMQSYGLKQAQGAPQ